MKPIFLLILFILTSSFIDPFVPCTQVDVCGKWKFVRGYKGRLNSIDTLTIGISRQSSFPTMTYEKSGRFVHNEGFVKGSWMVDSKNCHLIEIAYLDSPAVTIEDIDTFTMEITYVDSNYMLLYDVPKNNRNYTFLYRKIK
jgi:hypothetical protein